MTAVWCSSSGVSRATALGDLAGEVLRHQPGLGQDLFPLPMRQELLRQAERARPGSPPRVAQQPATHASPNPPARPLSSTVTTSR